MDKCQKEKNCEYKYINKCTASLYFSATQYELNVVTKIIWYYALPYSKRQRITTLLDKENCIDMAGSGSHSHGHKHQGSCQKSIFSVRHPNAENSKTEEL